jgi:mono/diheme cytochrome c family protein
MRLRAVIIGTLFIGILRVLAGLAWTWRSAIEPISLGAKQVADSKAIRQGAELAEIGNCSDCHTTKSGAPYAGGRALDASPYGTIYSSNITPDPETGIGTWSEEAFRRAMHEGVDREGRHLYPAFPYDHFTHATDQDIHALYVFLMSQQAVRSTVPANDLKFPFNIRLLAAGWKILVCTPIHTDLARDRTVDDYQRRSHVGCGLYAIEIERGIGHSQHSGPHYGRVFGFATSHDHVDGQDLASQRTPARCNFALDKVCIAAKGLNDGVDFVLRGWDDR